MLNRPLQNSLQSLPVFNSSRPQARSAEALWLAIRTIAGAFSILVALGLLITRLTSDSFEALKSPELKPLKESLRLNPTDESTKWRIRELDLQLRTGYFRRLSRSSSGAYLLLG